MVVQAVDGAPVTTLEAFYKKVWARDAPDQPVKLTVRDGDPDLLKVMACMRMKDQETKNTRNATLAVGGTLLQRLLAGEEQSFTMHDQFVQGNYTEVVMRVARSEPVGDLSQLALSRSSLWDIDTVFQPVVQENSNTIMSIFVSNHMQPTKGGAGFLERGGLGAG